MNKKYIAISILSFALLLSACNREPQPAPQQSVSQSESASSSSQPAQSVSSSSEASSVSSEASSASVDINGMVEISVPVYTDTGAQGTLSMHVPEAWAFDGYNVLSQDGVKTMEIVRAAEVADTENPISDDITYGFGDTDDMEYPDGYGLIDTFEGVAGGNDYKMFVYKIIADNGEVWYPHYAFIHMGDYVLQVHFYPFSQADEMATYINVMKSMSITF